MASLLLRNATIQGACPGVVDIRVSGETVAEVGTALGRRPGEECLDCGGGVVLPGLTDHHLHLLAMAAARTSVRCGPPAVTSWTDLAGALAAAVPDEQGWIRGTGYTESVAGDLDATALDRLRADRPAYVQHRSGALWMLNTAALTAIGLSAGVGGHASHPGIERDHAGRPTGRFWRADDWVRERLPRRPFPDLAPVGRELAGYGITAVTDATPDLAPAVMAAISDAVRDGDLPPRVQLLGVPLGTTIPGTPGLTVGPYKIVLADSGLPAYPELAELVAAAHGTSRPVAVHCVTREALILLIAVLRDVGTLPGDRIEHAALVPSELIPELASLGLRVVTQPGFLPDRGDDFLRDLPADDHQDLYRCASLLRAGVRVALSSDAPYGPTSPWDIIAAATTRETASGRVAGAAERISAAEALDACLTAPEDPGGRPARIRPGVAATLLVLHGPLASLPSGTPPRAVLSRGRLIMTE